MRPVIDYVNLPHYNIPSLFVASHSTHMGSILWIKDSNVYLWWALNLVFVDWYLTHAIPNFLYTNRNDFKSALLLSLLTSFPGSSLAVPYLGRRSGNEPLSLTPSQSHSL